VKVVKGGIGALRSNTGLRERSAFMDTVHVFDVPVQSGAVVVSASGSPSHLTKTDPGSAIAVRVTDAVLGKVASQVVPQLIPAGLEVTVPEPNPELITFKLAAPAGPANKIVVSRKKATPVTEGRLAVTLGRIDFVVIETTSFR